MTATYFCLDSSCVLRVLLENGEPLPQWGAWDAAFASVVAKVEVRRTLARVSAQGRLGTPHLARATAEFLDAETTVRWVPLEPDVVALAGGPLPLPLKALDAIHLGTAVAVREAGLPDLVFATHDRQLARVAAAMGLAVAGV